MLCLIQAGVNIVMEDVDKIKKLRGFTNKLSVPKKAQFLFAAKIFC